MKRTNNSSRMILLIQTGLLFEQRSFEQIISLMNQGAGTSRQRADRPTQILLYFFNAYVIYINASQTNRHDCVHHPEAQLSSPAEWERGPHFR